MITNPGFSDFVLITKSSVSAPRANNTDRRTRVGRGVGNKCLCFFAIGWTFETMGGEVKAHGAAGSCKNSTCREFLMRVIESGRKQDRPGISS